MKKVSIVLFLVIALIIGLFLMMQGRNQGSIDESTKNGTYSVLTPVTSISHGHGLAVDIENPNKLYIATHYGLFLLQNDKDLYRIGESQDDYMGFSIHPTNPNIFFTSGHPQFGGNLGIQKSEDGGITWRKISNGVNGPVDFHTMTISPANPMIMYGWYMNSLQRSLDGGKNWEIARRSFPEVISLTADLEDENILLASTAQGLMISADKGEGWSILSEQLDTATVFYVAIDPHNPQVFISSSNKLGLARSADSGNTWERIDSTINDNVLYIAFSKKEKGVIYLLTQNSLIFKSTNSGQEWSRVF